MSDPLTDAMAAAVQRAIPTGSDLWCETKARSILKTLDAGGTHLFTVDSLAAALVEVEESKLDPRCIADQCDHRDDDPRCMDTSLGCGDAAAIIQAAKEAERE